VDDRGAEAALLRNLGTRQTELRALLEECSSHWGFEDSVYRFYHQSYKVYALQETTVRIVRVLESLAPDRPLNPWFRMIVEHEIDSLLGIEGSATRIYFEHFAGMVKVDDEAERPAFDFNGRNRRPPRDPVNALLSLGYSLLTRDLTVVCHIVGFYPFMGFYHQRVSKRLQRQLERYFEDGGLGEVLNAPLDVILTPHDVVEPDLIVVTDPRQISQRGIEGAPTIVVEILSPSTADRDRTLKAKRYEATGVPHYWVADVDAQRLDCYRLSGAQYVLVTSAIGNGRFLHPDWPDLQIDPGAIWR